MLLDMLKRERFTRDTHCYLGSTGVIAIKPSFSFRLQQRLMLLKTLTIINSLPVYYTMKINISSHALYHPLTG